MKNRNLIVFFVISIVLTIVICVTAFYYLEIVNPYREEPIYQEDLPDDLFN